jgi:hypothetical protein
MVNSDPEFTLHVFNAEIAKFAAMAQSRLAIIALVAKISLDRVVTTRLLNVEALIVILAPVSDWPGMVA